MIRREREETGERTGGIFIALLLDKPSRRLWKEGHADSENETPNELNRDGDLPRSARALVLGGVVDDGSDEEADGDHPLIARDDGTTVFDDRAGE